ncbi:hypothetical protein FSARC_14228 [Fusarium sarcochroum]|uniref:Fork-head domain-containing protein n=1 Tax=Fusarium sarcochroum TaxID=1208366 RepID=A0A8H4SV63_9HYPO|nr:hypothetical protein FSARC_14228 [Fusarium sarcochroum]
MAKHTRFPGSNEPLQIFQDDIFENVTPSPMNSRAPMSSKPPRRPLTSSNANAVFNPPTASHNAFSPYKQRPASSSQIPLASPHGNRLNMASMPPPSKRGHVTDSLQKKPFLSNFKTVPPKLNFDMSWDLGKENVHPQIFPAPSPIDLSADNFYQKPNGKRGLMDAAPIKDSRPAKKIKSEPATTTTPTDIPRDDGNKPQLSYAQLIGMAILRSPTKKLTLSAIYHWISSNYSFYSLQDAGWQNSIRHNLSLHKNFIKSERPKDDPGKGNYWMIQPGTESVFLKEKSTRKSASASENLPVMSTRLEPSRPASAPTQEPTLPPPVPVSQSALPPLPTSQATMSIPVDLSSDATIPVSDNIGPEDVVDRVDDDAALDSFLYSPLPAAMHSSPPVSRHVDPRSNTPPPMSRNPASSVSRSHKRKFASMDDSGYISSLESSAMRPSQKFILTSEADRPRNKSKGSRGRAEEEIARLRNSSPFSPTKSRFHTVMPPVSSSPVRPANKKQMLPPLTPTVKLMPHTRPPPSASPNTSLRMHRDRVQNILQSPLRRVQGVTEEPVPWSPAFNLDGDMYSYAALDIMNEAEMPIPEELLTFDGIDDTAFAPFSSIESGSPVKRPTKRARLDRTVSASALGDITKSATNKPIASAPLLKAPEQSNQFDTPSKMFEGLSSPCRMFQQSPIRNQSPSKYSDFLRLPLDGEWPSMMDPLQFAAPHTQGHVDMLQGFAPIGSRSQGDSSNNSRGNNPPRGNRPPPSRTTSSMF